MGTLCRCRYYRWCVDIIDGVCSRWRVSGENVAGFSSMFKCSNVRKHWRQRGGCGGRADGLLPRQSNYICNCTNRAIGNNHTMGQAAGRDPQQPSQLAILQGPLHIFRGSLYLCDIFYREAATFDF